MHTNQILAGVLAAQLALAAVTWWPRSDVASEAAPLVDAAAADVSAIEIQGMSAPGAAADPVRLVREGGTWVVASANGYPADPGKITELLDRLTGIRLRDPITTQATSQRQLGVAADAYTRKVTLAAGGRTTTFYLGAGQGSSVNVRRDGTNEVYRVPGFTAWTVGDAPARYFDTSYVKVDPATVTSLTVRNAAGALTLRQEGGAWISAEDPTRPIDAREAQGLARKLLDVRMTKPVARGMAPDHGLTGGVRVEWTATGEPASGGYTIGAESEGARYVMADGKEWVVAVNAAGIAQAQTVTWADLLPEPEMVE